MSSKTRREKCGHLSIYQVYYEIHGQISFLYFLLMAAKDQSQFGQNI